MSLSTSFKDKTVLVTGAGRGIGKATVIRLYEYGATIYALSRNENSLSLLKSQCPNITTICVDLNNWNSTRAAVSKIGPVDCLVNNAAVLIGSDFHNITEEDLDTQLNVNLKAVINVSQVIVQKMIEKGKGGSIVNISSVGAKKGQKSVPVYCATKVALEMFSRCMAMELGQHKIRVNCVSPAGVQTDMLNDLINATPTWNSNNTEESANMAKSVIPMGEGVMPMDDVVNTILFALSDFTTMLTGTTLMIDGGYTIV